MYVRGLLEQELGLARLEQGGLKIYTTLDLDLNETARDVARYGCAAGRMRRPGQRLPARRPQRAQRRPSRH